MDSAATRIASFEAMLARGQDSEMLRFTLGSAYFDEGQFNEAIAHLTAAVALKPDYTAAWKVLGRAHAAADDREAAIAAFDRGLEAGTQNGDKQSHKEIEVFRRRVLKADD